MIKRIKIKGYKSLSDFEVSLKPLSVLFGPNAAGKSNFLDALLLLSRITTSRRIKDAFELPYRGKPLESFTFGDNGIKGLLEKESATFSFEVDLELSQSVIDNIERQIRERKQTKVDEVITELPRKISEKFLRYSVEIEIIPKSGILRVVNEYLAALNPKGTIKGNRKPFLEKVQDRLHLRMEGQAHPTYYECGLDYSILSISHYTPHYPHLEAMREELARWFFFYFEPRERMRAPNPVKEVRHIGLMGEELASFLNTLHALDERQFKTVEKALHTIIPTVTGIDVGVNDFGEVELKVLEGNTPIPVRVLSEGTLRILGLLALSGVKEPPALVGFEEPENGIHPRKIKMIADYLKRLSSTGDTQLIITTHSPILLDLIPTENLYDCRKKGGHTEIVPFESYGPLFRKDEIGEALNADETLVSERILRGDFDE
jgi:predicted ATPase